MPTPTEIRETIRRAHRQAIKDAAKLDADALANLQRIYREAADDIARRLAFHSDDVGRVRLEALLGLRDQVNAALSELSKIIDKTLADYLRNGASLGADTWTAALPAGRVLAITDEAVRAVRAFTAADGLQLSDRIWRLERHAREVVTQAIESAVIQGHSASQAAQEFLRNGQSVPVSVQQTVNGAGAKQLAKTTAEALLTGDGSPYANARRVFRTEINRSHGMAYQSSVFENDDVIGTRFLLSPGHPRPDICDMHSKANRFGLGKGVYPKGRSPWPAHPNTLSYEEVVYADEVSEEDRREQESGIDWLHRQSPEMQYNVLNSQMKQQALQAGLLTDEDIALPWREIREKYEGAL